MTEINKADIKLMQAQNLDDTDEGGGQMTVHEVVDGNVNNLFPDISRLDRTYGRVSLRKAFLSVQTEDRATYYGSHIAITEQAEDPLVNVTFFSTENWSDMREDAINNMESYLAIGPIYPAALWGDHYAGSRLITMFAQETYPLMAAGDVFSLYGDQGFEYVRITEITSEVQEFDFDTTGTYKKQIITVEISNALANNYDGNEIIKAFAYTSSATPINTTVVADAARYYGVAKLADPITSGEFGLKVDGIFQSVVPSAQTSTAITDFGIGVTTSTIMGLAGTPVTRQIVWSISSNTTLSIGEAFEPGSMTFGTYYDDGQSNFCNSSGTIIGSIDYLTGDITCGGSIATVNTTQTLQYAPAAIQSQVSNSGVINVSLSNRTFSYVYNCYPNPMAMTLRVDYLSGGNWYSLYDIGGGKIEASDTSIGVGTVNYLTGTVALSLGYLPDIDSSILFFWGQSLSVLDIGAIDIPTEGTIELDDEHIVKDTFSMTWLQNSITYTVTDTNGTLFVDDDTGVSVPVECGNINYGKGSLTFLPHITPRLSTIFNINYQAGEGEEESPVVAVALGAEEGEQERSCTLATGGIIPGSLYFEVMIKSDFIPTGEVSSTSTPFSTYYTYTNSYCSRYYDYWCYSRSNYSYTNTYQWRSDVVDTVSIPQEFACSMTDNRFTKKVRVIDDGLGVLYDSVNGYEYGTIDYATGELIFTITEFFDYVKNNKEVSQESRLYSTSTYEYPEQILTSTSNEEALMYPQDDAFDAANFSIKYRTSEGSSAVDSTTTMQRIYLIDQGDILPLLPGALSAYYNGDYVIDNGQGEIVIANYEGDFTKIGEINYSEKTVTITAIDSFSDSGNLHFQVTNAAATTEDMFITGTSFRAPNTDLVPGSFTFRITSAEGEVLTATADIAGDLDSDYIKGHIDQVNGVANIIFGSLIENTVEVQEEDWWDAAYVSEDTFSVWKPLLVDPNSAIMSCVVSSYLPLDADLLGLNTVRLPIDGKVPIFKDGEIILIHNTEQYTCPTPLSANQSFNVGRTDLGMIELYDSLGVYIPETANYIVDIATGDVVMEDPLDLSAYTEPLVALHRIEDMMLVSDVQVTGNMACTSAITNNYDAANTYVSSILPIGDIQARVYNKIVQKSWSGEWSNLQIGDGILSNFDDVNYPIEVVNKNATQERWALIFESSTTVKVVGENLGVIATGVSILNDISYPADGNPYFIIRKEGWGSGWSTGNVVRFNTAAGNFPVWFCRATLQGPPTESSDNYTIAIRGDSS